MLKIRDEASDTSRNLLRGVHSNLTCRYATIYWFTCVGALTYKVCSYCERSRQANKNAKLIFVWEVCSDLSWLSPALVHAERWYFMYYAGHILTVIWHGLPVCLFVFALVLHPNNCVVVKWYHAVRHYTREKSSSKTPFQLRMVLKKWKETR